MRESEGRKQDWVEGCGAVTSKPWSTWDRELCRWDIVPIGGVFI